MTGRVAQTRPPSGRRAVVIGSGFGGLAAAVRLAARGWDVEVIERHEQAGGRARVFRQDGFVFDAGPTVITAPQLFEELWTLCGKRMADFVDLRAGSSVLPHAFPRRAVRRLLRRRRGHARSRSRAIEPGDVDGYERFVAMSERIFDVGFERLAHVPFGSWTAMAKAVPDMVRLQSYRNGVRARLEVRRGTRRCARSSRFTRSSSAAIRSGRRRFTA